jgi:multidrug efflux pump subunit AcrB
METGMTPSPSAAPAASAGRLGFSGRITAFFLEAQITPLLALVSLLLGLWAVLVTPREEEPQIDVTMANVIVPFPGASVADVASLVATPGEQVLAQMPGTDHVYASAYPGLAVITVQFQVGVPRSEALVRLYDTVNANADWLPQGLGVGTPLVKPKGVDDVPVLALTLFSRSADGAAPALTPTELERVAHSLEAELKRVPGTREVATLGGPGRVVRVVLDPARLATAGLTANELRQALQGAHLAAPLGERLAGDRAVALEAGPWLGSAAEVGELVVGAKADATGSRPIFLREVAAVEEGPALPARLAWHGEGGAQGTDHPAVTLAITKKPGENAIAVTRAVLERVETLRNTLIPAGVEVAIARNDGDTANDKANQLIKKLMFATASVVLMVMLALGWRAAAVVGSAVVLTLALTLFASWAWGFTLNRVSLFALIFSIGILVDDAIVVVENIHRRMALAPDAPLAELIPAAVDEVGGPTLLATLTVIAALLPMAFVSGLMGPYMAPIPINASLGMALSLAVALIVTPWLARRWLAVLPNGSHGSHGHDAGAAAHGSGFERRLAPWVERVFAPLLHAERGTRNRRWLGVAVAALIAAAVALPVVGAVVLKMLPFDNKSAFQVVVDMPAGTPVERTAAVLRELGAELRTAPEVADWQAYAGGPGPINFNGLVRQYFLRSGGEVGELQVRLVPKAEREDQSHAIAVRLRPALQAVGARHGANVKVVEVPPGPPVLSPIVAEVYGPDAEGRRALAREIRRVFEATDGVVDVDASPIADAPRTLFTIDRRKAAMRGVAQRDIVATLRAGLAGEPVAWLHDGSRHAVPLVLQLPAERHGELEALLALTVKGASGTPVAVRELVNLTDTLREQPLHRKDGAELERVVADTAGAIDSPLYGLFAARPRILALATPDGQALAERFIQPPEDPWRGYTVRWDGEWQITYETFRDMGAAYAVGLVLIYLLVVAQFGSYVVPLIIMAPIPLTVVGVMPGHALLGAPFGATSMIGMIALAGIIVRNSILLVDFMHHRLAVGESFERAVVQAVTARAQPIALTALAAMGGAIFILDDPIFNGLAISLLFGIFVSTLLTLVLIPLLFYVVFRHRVPSFGGASPAATAAA